jgi:acetyltransferase
MKVSLPVAHERLIGICFPDYDREIALVAYYKDPKTGASSIVAVARLRKIPWSGEAEMALVVSDELQNRGLGSELIRQLLAIGRQEGVLQISAEFLVENATMQHLCQKLGFRLERGTDESLTRAVIDLAAKDHSKALQAS